MHIVSEVTGQLRDGLSYADVLKAALPAGTVSAAPKIRALQVIAQLEPIKRNISSGQVGTIGWHGDADTAIAFRTPVIPASRLTVHVSPGTLHTSHPARGWAATIQQGHP